MVSNFPRILTMLRHERNLSQKAVAKALNISQPLLSNYENGKRECTVSFLKKVSEFYGVSCDLLLCISPHESLLFKERPIRAENVYSQCERVILSYAQSIGNEEFEKTVKDWFSLFYYKLFRCIFDKNPENPKTFFSVGECYERELLSSILDIDKALSDFSNEKDLSCARISINSLVEDYPEEYKSFVSMLVHAEEIMLKDSLE